MLGFGGTPPDTGKTESCDGTSWTEVSDLGTSRAYLAGSVGGTNTLALAFGGYHGNTPPPNGYENKTEKFDGTNWTETGDLNTARSDMGGAGSQTAAIAFGGNSPAAPNTNLVESFNGASWTEMNGKMSTTNLNWG